MSEGVERKEFHPRGSESDNNSNNSNGNIEYGLLIE